MPFVNNKAQGQGRVVAAAPLNVEVISDVMDIRGLHQMTLFIDLVRGGTLTALVTEIDCSIDGLGSWKPVQNQAQTPPDKALVDQTWTKTTSVSAVWAFDVAEDGRLSGPFMRLRFNGTAATAADVLTVDVYGEA